VNDASHVIGLPAREPFLTRQQLAERLGVHACTVDEWRKEPGFPEERWGPRTIRFQEGRVVAWLRDRQRRAA
jgi:predicted DNA-binding transcriptional regulator AlpA